MLAAPGGKPFAPASSHRSRILIIGDGVAPTGYTRVIESVFAPLTDRFHLHQLATNYFGAPRASLWEIEALGDPRDPQGPAAVVAAIERLAPDVVFILNDVWLLADYLNAAKPLLRHIGFVLYCPIDSGPIPPRFVPPFAGACRLVTCTGFGRSQFEAAATALPQDEREALPPIEVIPLGVDTGSFRPLSEDAAERQALARRLIYPDVAEWQDAFVVLNANRNQPRKRIDTTIQGFALFAADKPPDVKLHLHMGVEKIGWDVLELGRRLGIDDRVVMTTMEPRMPNLAAADLNVIYNACDVGLNTASGEGWGLVSFEHAATGAAQIVPAHSACRELWADSALLLEPSFSHIDPESLAELPMISPRTVADALERLYRDRALCDALGRAAFANAVRPEYQWNAIAERWAGLFGNVMAEAAAA